MAIFYFMQILKKQNLHKKHINKKYIFLQIENNKPVQLCSILHDIKKHIGVLDNCILEFVHDADFYVCIDDTYKDKINKQYKQI